MIHDFIEHYPYPNGKRNPFEDKPIDIKHLGNITTCEILVNKNLDYYNFKDSKQLADDFLNNFIRTFIISYGLSIKNFQPAPF